MSSDFWIILIGTLVACSCSLVGCFLLLRKMAMMGDAISHAILPGIVIATLMSGSRNSLAIIIAASLFGLITVFLIQMFQQSGVQSDAAIGIVFTGLFAIGVILVSLFARQTGIDLDCVLFGEIAYAPWRRFSIAGIDLGPQALWTVGLVFLVSLTCITLFYKQFKICTFDPVMAALLGIPVMFFHYLLMALTSFTAVAAFDSVGVILVVGMLIIPPSTAYLLTEKLSKMLLISMLLGAISAVGGYYLAVYLNSSISACMVFISGILFILTLFFSPTHGTFIKWKLISGRKFLRKK